jgi:hypothetical protein
MTDASEYRLEQAYELIRSGQPDEAIAILQSILQLDDSNVDAWWLVANAVTEPEEARGALKKVLEYQPDHAQAQDLMNRLNEMYPPVEEAETDLFSFGESDEELDSLYGDTELHSPLDSAPEPPLSLPEIPAMEDTGEWEDEEEQGQEEVEEAPEIRSLSEGESDTTPAVDLGALWDDEDEGLPPFEGEPDFIEGLETEDESAVPEDTTPTEAVSRRRNILRPVLIVLIILLVAVFAVTLLLRNQPAAPAAPTQALTEVAQMLEPSDDVQTVLEAVENAANAQANLLGGTSSVMYESRDGMATIVLRVCRPAGADLTSAMNVAMDIAARFGLTVQDEIGGIGAEFVNCDRDDRLLAATAPIADAVSFANGQLTQDQFRATWSWQDQ